jgi:hypothetical protein
MEISGQLYAVAVLLMLHVELVAEWDPETVCMIGKEEIFCPCRQMNQGS